MTIEEYREYLQSQHWTETRMLKLAAADYRCEECYFERCQLEIHHLHYRSLWREEMRDLRCCCRRCHRRLHEEAEIERHNISWAQVAARLADANRRWERQADTSITITCRCVTNSDQLGE